ncbi:MAG: glycosyltransferase [Bacteroidaceae bacterium]|nr:glycosyltransferase [Bacteroidaceae bacterium]
MKVAFSVLMSIYRKERPDWLREAMESIFSQSAQPSEIVMVKDGPLTEELEAVIDEYSSRYPIFKFVVNEMNLGLGLALQRGLLACSNEYVARMDTDDTMPVDRFEKQLSALVEGDNDLVSCWSTILTEDMQTTVAVKQRPEHHEDIVKLAKRRSPVCHAGSFFRKSAVLNAGNYQHSNSFYEDYDLWIRMIMSGARFYNVQESLYNVRTTEGQIKRRGGFNYLKVELSTFRRYYKMGFYSLKDLFLNSAIRIVVRLMPGGLRKSFLVKIWNFKK